MNRAVQCGRRFAARTVVADRCLGARRVNAFWRLAAAAQHGRRKDDDNDDQDDEEHGRGSLG